MEKRGPRSDKPLTHQVVAHRLNDYLADGASICGDAGTITTWAVQHIAIRSRFECV